MISSISKNFIQQKYLQASQVERGQALSEVLLMISAIFILFIGINMSTSLQISAVQLLINSFKKVSQVHLGVLKSSEQKNEFTLLGKNKLSNTKLDVLLDELNMAHPGTVAARSHLLRRLWPEIKVSRQSHIEVGDGYASSDLTVQHNVKNSSTLWRNHFNLSLEVMRKVSLHASKTDTAWMRPKMTEDLIRPWAGVVPE